MKYFFLFLILISFYPMYSMHKSTKKLKKYSSKEFWKLCPVDELGSILASFWFDAFKRDRELKEKIKEEKWRVKSLKKAGMDNCEEMKRIKDGGVSSAFDYSDLLEELGFKLESIVRQSGKKPEQIPFCFSVVQSIKKQKCAKLKFLRLLYKAFLTEKSSKSVELVECKSSLLQFNDLSKKFEHWSRWGDEKRKESLDQEVKNIKKMFPVLDLKLKRLYPLAKIELNMRGPFFPKIKESLDDLARGFKRLKEMHKDRKVDRLIIRETDPETITCLLKRINAAESPDGEGEKSLIKEILKEKRASREDYIVKQNYKNKNMPYVQIYAANPLQSSFFS